MGTRSLVAWVETRHGRRFAAIAGSAVLCVALAGCGGSDNTGPVPATGTSLSTLSGRADLVTGGSTLVEVKLPAGSSATKLKVMVGTTDVTSAFTTRADGRTVGLIAGLATGVNTLTVTATDRSFAGATLTVTNHAIGGPLLLASQPSPWICATPVPTAATATTPATNASGLSTAASDAQCNINAETALFYRTLTPVSVTTGDGGCSFVLPDPSPTIASPTPKTPANSCLQPYVVGTTPATAVATTTPLGSTVMVPYIVRRERGTINRGIFDIAVLFDPAKPWSANTPQAQWTGKLIHSYGSNAGQPRLQFRSAQNWADDSALSRGFMVADNSMTDSRYNTNDIVAVETTMMMKEYVTKNYGEIKYTLGNGCSGGSVTQNSIASTFPGVLDGIQLQCNLPDFDTVDIQVADCVQLVNFYGGSVWKSLMSAEGMTTAQDNAKRTAINGHLDQTGCQSWNNAFGFVNKPGVYTQVLIDPTGRLVAGATTNNCLLPASQVYDPLTNPLGTRCSHADLSIGIYGTAPGTARANQTTDNVGIQYGLKALLAGAIDPEEFVTLNEGIGGVDADSDAIATRSVADLGGLTASYRTGLVSSGAQLAKLPVIDMRGYDETGSPGVHFIWFSFAERDRLDADGGGHGNQVLWRFGANGLTPPPFMPLQSLLTMDAWLSALNGSAPKASLNAERTSAQVVAAKPALVGDYCYLSTDTTYSNQVTDFSDCDRDPKLAIHSSPRQVAGGPRAENVLKCTLKPLALSDYAGITWTATQQNRLQAVFTTGVCDWSKAGVGQTAAVSPLTFAAGPGGTALPAAPVSAPL